MTKSYKINVLGNKPQSRYVTTCGLSKEFQNYNLVRKLKVYYVPFAAKCLKSCEYVKRTNKN